MDRYERPSRGPGLAGVVKGERILLKASFCEIGGVSWRRSIGALYQVLKLYKVNMWMQIIIINVPWCAKYNCDNHKVRLVDLQDIIVCPVAPMQEILKVPACHEYT